MVSSSFALLAGSLLMLWFLGSFLVLWVVIVSFGALSAAGWVGVFGRFAPFSWSHSNLVFLMDLRLLVWFAIRGLFVLDLCKSSFVVLIFDDVVVFCFLVFSFLLLVICSSPVLVSLSF